MHFKALITVGLILISGSLLQSQSNCIEDCLGDSNRYGEAAGLNNTASQVSIFGRSAGLNNTGEANSFFGFNAGREAKAADNSFFGHDSGRFNISGSNNSFFGSESGMNNTGSRNSFFGRRAGHLNAASDNSFFGYTAGDSTTTGSWNSFFGSGSGKNNKHGDSNSFFGESSGRTNTYGEYNSFFGAETGYANTTGDNNSFFGYQAGTYTTNADWNSFFGSAAGYENTTGEENSFFGAYAGLYNETGDHNSFFGTDAGVKNISGNSNSFFGDSTGYYITGSNNIVLGAKSGPPEEDGDVDSTLFIDVFVTNAPLIYGHFGQRMIRINGTFEAMGGVNNASDINRKEEIVPVNELDILDRVSDIELSEWSYKGATDVRHLGPMAQDFYKAFGLGENDTTISTLDADGVALASIQALYKLWQEEKERNDRLEQKVDALYQMMKDTEE